LYRITIITARGRRSGTFNSCLFERRDLMEDYKKPLAGKLEEFRIALEEEIKEIKKNSSSAAVPITSGSKIRQLAGEYVYRFRIDTSINSPSDTPVTIVVGKSTRYDAVIVSFEEPHIVLATQKDMGDFVGSGRLENDISILLKKLISRIEEKSEMINIFGEKMLNVNSYSGIVAELLTEPRRQLTKRQREAVGSAVGRDLTYIWGPPGTGKTTIIGEIIEELYRREKTVLLVSHTNIAVDGAIEKVCEELKEELEDFPVLRLGQTLSKKITERYREVTLKEQIDAKSKDLLKSMELKISEKDNAIKQFHHAESVVEKCSYVINVNETREQMEEDLHNVDMYLEKRKSAASNIKDLVAGLDELAEKEKIISRHDELLEEKNIRRSQHNKQQELILTIENELQEAEKSRDDIEEQIIYNRKRRILEERKAQLFTPEKQRDIIREIEAAIEKKKDEKEQILTKEKELNEKLSKLENASLLAKALNKFRDKNKILSELNDIAYSKVELDNQLAGMEVLKNNKTKEYREILAIYNELESFPETPPNNEVNKKSRQLKEKIAQLEGTLVKERDSIEFYIQNMMDADSLFDEFKKTITFDFNKVLNEIQSMDYLLEQNQNDYHMADIALSEIIEEKYLIHCQSDNYAEGAKRLHAKFLNLDREVENIKEELGCSNSNEIKRALAEANEIKKILSESISTLKKEIDEIQEKLAEIENDIIANAKIIGTTLTKGYLCDALHKRKFDTVILDEASMASIPALWVTAYLASGSIVIVGDFRQLSPIAMSEHPLAKKWLATGIFRHSRVDEQCDPRYVDKSDNIVILNEQFRMHKQIAELANRYYLGILETPNGNPGKRGFEWYRGIGEREPINIIDTKNFAAWVTSVTNGRRASRLNYLSATLCVALAKKLVHDLLDSWNDEIEKSPKILIICPYRPHAKRMELLLEQEGLLGFIRTGTVHSFQGSEADVVIFDLVVDEPHWKVGVFNAQYNESNERLFNVAITRARHKLFFVGNIDYCIKNSNKNSELRRLLEEITSKDNIRRFDGKEIFPTLYHNYNSLIRGQMEIPTDRMCMTQEWYYDYLYQDIENAKNRIIIYSPFISRNRLGEVMLHLYNAVNSGVKVHVVTKAPEERRKKETPGYDEMIKFMKSHNINVIYKKSMHEKMVFIDEDIIWSGSLNTLSFYDTQEVMERRVNKAIFDDYVKLMHVEEFIEIMTGEECNCPICGDQMILSEGVEQPYFFRCINKGCFTMSIGQQYPKNGKLNCQKCGGDLSFSMINEPRWICDNNKRHYMKVRKSHLRLPAMVEKIPKRDIKKVELYFNEGKRG